MGSNWAFPLAFLAALSLAQPSHGLHELKEKAHSAHARARRSGGRSRRGPNPDDFVGGPSTCVELDPPPRARLRFLINGTETPVMASMSVDSVAYLYKMLPFVASGWKRYGVNSIIFVVGLDEQTEAYQEVLDELKRFDATVISVPAGGLFGYKALVAQQMRIYAAILPFKEDTIIVMSDADIHPGLPDHVLRIQEVLKTKSLYLVQPPTARSNAFKIPYSCSPKIDATRKYNEFFMWYIGMRVGGWRKVLGTLGTDFNDLAALPELVIEQMRKVYGRKIKYKIIKRERRFSAHHLIYSDQQLLSMMLHLHFLGDSRTPLSDHKDVEPFYRKTLLADVSLTNRLKRRMERSVNTQLGRYQYWHECPTAYQELPHEMHGGCHFEGECLDRLVWFVRCIHTPKAARESLRKFCSTIVKISANQTEVQAQCARMTEPVEWKGGSQPRWALPYFEGND